MVHTDFMNRLSGICRVEPTFDGFRVTTQCMYPSNGLVRVTVRVGEHYAIVSDEGEALGEASAAGIEVSNPDKLLRHSIAERGLIIRDGVISTSRTEIETVHIAILHVANVAKETAMWLYDHGGVKRKQDFRTLLKEYLESSFREQVSEALVRGASNKPHKFANVISFSNGRKFIVDAVSNDQSSINSRVVANFDVRSACDPNIEQRIVYSDSEHWTASDLSILQIGATPVPFSKAREVIQRVAEQTRDAA